MSASSSTRRAPSSWNAATRAAFYQHGLQEDIRERGAFENADSSLLARAAAKQKEMDAVAADPMLQRWSTRQQGNVAADGSGEGSQQAGGWPIPTAPALPFRVKHAAIQPLVPGKQPMFSPSVLLEKRPDGTSQASFALVQ
mmetsp:Transcript_28764/g.66839  ORF Transcript_28764/g.66839 Transcript_28764/m.66839 type:complete len:141 (+) Transcript_28764:72-494(+)